MKARSVQTGMRGSFLVAAITATVVSSCGGTGAPEWGPLALVDATGDMARTEGTLRIMDGCVLLERDGEEELLVWPADRSRWNAADGTISFTTLAGEEVVMESGQAVVLGGGGSSVAEDGEMWADSIAWVRRPAANCLTDSAWFISDAQ